MKKHPLQSSEPPRSVPDRDGSSVCAADNLVSVKVTTQDPHRCSTLAAFNGPHRALREVSEQVARAVVSLLSKVIKPTIDKGWNPALLHSLSGVLGFHDCAPAIRFLGFWRSRTGALGYGSECSAS